MADQLSISTFLLSACLIVLTVSGQLIPQERCQWEVSLKTGNQPYAATQANIDMDINFGPLGHYPVFNLRQYGVRGQTYPYFRRNQLDIFRFDGPCDPAFCRVTFHNGATGKYPGWFLVFATVRVTVPAIGNLQRNATVNRWLSKAHYPYLWDVTVDYCQQTISNNAHKQSKKNN